MSIHQQEPSTPTATLSGGFVQEPIPATSKGGTLVIRPVPVYSSLPGAARNRAERHAGMRRRRAL